MVSLHCLLSSFDINTISILAFNATHTSSSTINLNQAQVQSRTCDQASTMHIQAFKVVIHVSILKQFTFISLKHWTLQANLKINSTSEQMILHQAIGESS